jgi:hypothetical protein
MLSPPTTSGVSPSRSVMDLWMHEIATSALSRIGVLRES